MKKMILTTLFSLITMMTSFTNASVNCKVSSESEVLVDKVIELFDDEDNTIFEEEDYVVKLIFGGSIWIIVAGQKSADISNVYTMFRPLEKEDFIYTTDAIKNLSIDCRELKK